MKTLLLFAVCLVAASLLSSCKTDPSSANGPNLPLTMDSRTGGGGGSTPAHPALTCINQINTGSNHNPVLVDVLEVADSDATHSAYIYTASSSISSETLGSPCWASGGGSICFLDYTGVYNWSLKAIDVSVNSNGVAVGSNVRSIYTPAATDSVRLYDPRWSENSSTGQIAFIRLHYNHSQYGLFELCTISQSGGSVTVLESIEGAISGSNVINKSYMRPCWSPDDSKLAVSRQDTFVSGTGAFATLMIFNASTGSATDSMSLHALGAGMVPTCMRWSHSGTNKLAFTLLPSGHSTLYYCAPSTGSTPSTNAVLTSFVCWSPTNSSLLIGGGGAALQKNTPYTSTLSTIVSAFYDIGPIDWKH